MAIGNALCQAMSATSPTREESLRGTKPHPQIPKLMTPQSPRDSLSGDDGSVTQSSASSQRSSPLSTSDTPLSSDELTTVTTIQDAKRPLVKNVRIDTAPAKVLPLLPVRPVLEDLRPLPMYYYFYPTTEGSSSAPTTSSRSRHGPKSRSSTPSQGPYSSRRSSATPVSTYSEVLDELDAETFLVPTDTPCLLCKKDGIPCVPPRGTRHGQGCCVLCRATGSRCERSPVKTSKRARESFFFSTC